MTDNAGMIARNAAHWKAAKLTRGPEFGPVAKRLIAARNRYQAVSSKTGVPWFVIAVIHQRESSQDWHGSLAQGDPWNEISTHVPRGRGPFNSWEDAAIDALAVCPPYAAKWKDWTPGGTMTLLELYNGRGYFNKGIPSPYVWSGTDQYHSGKYVADGVFDPGAVDKQLGCAGLILAMKALDPSIAMTGETPANPIPPPPDIPKPEPAPQRSLKTAGVIAALIAMMGGVAAFVKTHPIETGIGCVLVIAAILYFTNRKS